MTYLDNSDCLRTSTKLFVVPFVWLGPGLYECLRLSIEFVAHFLVLRLLGEEVLPGLVLVRPVFCIDSIAVVVGISLDRTICTTRVPGMSMRVCVLNSEI